ncbi:MAG: hypothetical protein K2Z81_13505, partial [Cyanobacteria bacterium]|nr:hypothetical protein [Cyanobacteriota bacterium]
RSDGSREFGNLAAADAAAGPRRDGFRLTAGSDANHSQLHTRIGGTPPQQPWNVERDATTGQISRIQRPGPPAGQADIVPGPGGSIRFDAQGNVVQRAGDGSSTTYTPNGNTIARDTAGRISGMQWRAADGTMQNVAVTRTGDNITQVTLPGGQRLDGTARPITIDAAGNITQRGTDANRSTTYRPDGTRVERNGAIEMTFNAHRDGRVTSVKNAQGTLNIQYGEGNTIQSVSSGTPATEVARVGPPPNGAASIRVEPDGRVIARNATGQDSVIQPRSDAPARPPINNPSVRLDANGRVSEVTRRTTPPGGAAGTERIGFIRDTANPNNITGITRDGVPIPGATNISVDARTGRISYEANNVINLLNTDGSRSEVTLAGEANARRPVSVRYNGGPVMNIETNPQTRQITRVTVPGTPPSTEAREIAKVGPPGSITAIQFNERGQLIARAADQTESVIGNPNPPGTGITQRGEGNRPTQVTRLNPETRTNEQLRITYNGATITGITRGDGGPSIAPAGATNFQVNPETGQISYDVTRPGATPSITRTRLNLDGSSIETRDDGRRGAQPDQNHEHGIQRNEHGLITRQTFFRANGEPGERVFHYRMTPEGRPQLDAQNRPIVDRIDFQKPGPASLVRTSDGPPPRWRVESNDPRVQQMMARDPRLSQGWEADVRVDGEGNLNFKWVDGRELARPVNARNDRTPPAPGATPTPERTPPNPPNPADLAANPNSPLNRWRAMLAQQRARRGLPGGTPNPTRTA